MEGTIKFSSPEEFNDPFDSLQIFDESSVETYLRQNQRLRKRLLSQLGIPPSKFETHLPSFVAQVKTAISNGVIGPDLNKQVGICCLTQDPFNLLMWSHYADSHRGMVVEFEIPTNVEDIDAVTEIDFFENLLFMPVEYSPKLQVISLICMSSKPFAPFVMCDSAVCNVVNLAL